MLNHRLNSFYSIIQNSIIDNSKSLLVSIGLAGVAFDFTSSLSRNQQKSLLVAIGLVFTSSHPEQRS